MMKALFIAKIVLTLLWVGASPAYAGEMVIEEVTEAEFNAIHVTNVVWNVRAVPGYGSIPADHQIEIGDRMTIDQVGGTTWQKGANNPALIQTGSGAVTATFNGTDSVSIPMPSQPFNEVWISVEQDLTLYYLTNELEFSGNLNGTDLPLIKVTEEEDFHGIRVRLASSENFSSLTLSGDLIPNHFVAGDREWKFTVCAVMNHELEPAPRPDPLTLVMYQPDTTSTECVLIANSVKPLKIEFNDDLVNSNGWTIATAPFLKEEYVEGSTRIFVVDMSLIGADFCSFRLRDENP